MDSQEMLQECRKIWATNSQVRTEIDKLEHLNGNYERAFNDMSIAIRFFENGKPNAKKYIKVFYIIAERSLEEMGKIAEKLNNKKLIEYVNTKSNVLEDYRKRYLG